MTRQRQILVTVTYNDLGCIIDTKAEPYEEPNLQPTCNQLATDCISRQAAIDAIHNYWKKRLDTLPTKMTECGEVDTDIQSIDKILEHNKTLVSFIKALPSAQPDPDMPE